MEMLDLEVRSENKAQVLENLTTMLKRDLFKEDANGTTVTNVDGGHSNNNPLPEFRDQNVDALECHSIHLKIEDIVKHTMTQNYIDQISEKIAEKVIEKMMQNLQMVDFSQSMDTSEETKADLQLEQLSSFNREPVGIVTRYKYLLNPELYFEVNGQTPPKKWKRYRITAKCFFKNPFKCVRRLMKAKEYTEILRSNRLRNRFELDVNVQHL